MNRMIEVTERNWNETIFADAPEVRATFVNGSIRRLEFGREDSPARFVVESDNKYSSISVQVSAPPQKETRYFIVGTLFDFEVDGEESFEHEHEAQTRINAIEAEIIQSGFVKLHVEKREVEIADE